MRWLVSALTVLMCLLSGLAYAQEYTITDLGPGPAWGLNNSGRVVGDGFYWDAANGRQEVQFVLRDINDSGQAIGVPFGGGQGVVLDTINGGTVALGHIDGFDLIPNAINDANQVTGNTTGPTQVFLWDSINGAQPILADSFGRDINDSVHIVGERFPESSPVPVSQGFIWDELSGVVNLGVLDGNQSAANAINNMNQIVGNSEFSFASEQHHAVLWDANGIHDLSTLGNRPLNEDSSVANDINIFGKIVGNSNSSSSQTGVGGWRAVIWDEHGIRDLNDLIPSASGWVLGQATAINDLGQIAGFGILNGNNNLRAFLLTPIDDTDDDGIVDAKDLCPNTVIPETVPTIRLGVNRLALTDGDTIFDTRTPDGSEPQRAFTIADTAGCSCEQIIEALGLGQGHTKFGCSIDAMEEWLAMVGL